MTKIRILLGDDHQIVRQGIRALLDTQADFEVVGEAADGYELVEMAEKFEPHVVITDIAMPNMNGMEATRQIRKRNPKIQVIALSMHAATSYVIGCLNSGALGYLLKNDSYKEVIQSIHTVMKGKRYLSPQVSEKVMDAFLAEKGPRGGTKNHLTEREREVLQLIAEGNTNLQIAEKLSISIRTAEKHRANLREKLNITSQADLVHFAIQQGIVELKE